MARKKAKPGNGADTFAGPPGNAGGPGEETTGRFLVVFGDDAVNDPDRALAALRDSAGCSNVATSDDYEENAVDVEETAGADAVLFSTLGIAVVSGDKLPDLTAAVADAGNPIVAVEPERFYYAIDAVAAPPTRDYLRGYRDAVGDLYERFNGRADGAVAPDEDLEAQAFQDTNQFTWGLQATRVPTSRYSGQGVRVAVLDTGLDLTHPDFAGRQISSQSFVPGEAVQDGHGHGTHCTGTACGPRRVPGGTRRYGVAYGCHIVIGKVLSNGGSGAGANIIAGMEWAINAGCQVISMSLGNTVLAVSQAYETVGRRALDRGCLIVAAAGNHRTGSAPQQQTVPPMAPPRFEGQPANSPSILAVGALNNGLQLAPFSCRSNPVPGGRVDLVGPGVAVYSSWRMPQRYNTISGTSMATPHAAGIAALWCQATGARGPALWNVLTRYCRPVGIPSVDAGVGLVQAPQ